MKTFIAASIAVLLGTAAYAAEPVGSDKFNTEPGFDLSKLSADNFYDVVVPLAKKEGSVTLFDFTDSFAPLFTEHLIPEFEKKYGISVEYLRGEGAAAIQQLIAAHNSGSKAPADAYFISSGNLGTVMKGGVVANIALNSVLPSGAALDPAIATSTGGYQHGGAYLPFHRNQTAIIYDTRTVPTDKAPDDLDSLLAWAQANPGKFIVTSPTGGGSGSGFLQSITFAKVTGDACRATLTDYSITEEQAKAFAASDCMTPVWDYYKQLLPVVELTKGNSDTLTLIGNGAGSIGTVWEDMTYDFVGRGLLPPTVRLELLKSGQVGGGDGAFLPVGGEHPAAGLLLLDFLVSHDAQLEKLKINGSRSARTDIDPAASFTPEEVARLIPTDQFATRRLQNMPAVLNTVLGAYATANLLRTN
ncbi:extracellular solute-binding protein [Rhizobium sp. BK251]|uniref:extracellular solute-binding protein n=1 Tax=Rhizobium sp. BK251 TaxID=2512125 RepID=UPI00104F7624|nr:extracellular solute-binding protein [Rhizobium sp. BK251]TCL68126.1 multiple sugar transport system substrate-binding protein/putative spermidine/putrescine transport system substrate-binding protein [Rhizobium sp. BK251]